MGDYLEHAGQNIDLEPEWQCACGETDPTNHDIGMVIAHEYEIPEAKGREILLRIRKRFGLDND